MATVDDIDGYETANAKATVFVISQEAPVVTFGLSQESYTFAEYVGRGSAELVARLSGTATNGSDYMVTPADADQEAEDYQVILPVESTSVEVTLKAMSDDVNDPDEKIEIAAAVKGKSVGNMQAVRIMNQRMELPRITVAANRDTIIAGMEDLVFTATREAPLDQALTVTVRLTQDQSWLSQSTIRLNFAADGATSRFTFHASAVSSAVTESGTVTAVMDSVSGYDTGDAVATVFVVSQPGPAMKVSFSHEDYQFAEDDEDPFVTLVAQAAAGMPRGATITFTVSSSRGTAQSPDDYQPLDVQITVPEEDFAVENGLWQAQYQLPLTLRDDDVREGTESFDLLLERAPGSTTEMQLSDIFGATCGNSCATPVEITDGEDIPELELSLSAEEIREEGETSSTATVSITNSKPSRPINW